MTPTGHPRRVNEEVDRLLLERREELLVKILAA